MRHTQPTENAAAAWHAWVAERPASLREAVAAFKLDPWTLYRLKTTGQRVFLMALSAPADDGKVTCRVRVSGRFNFVTMERQVFGIDPADLEECDLPGPDELVGSMEIAFKKVAP